MKLSLVLIQEEHKWMCQQHWSNQQDGSYRSYSIKAYYPHFWAQFKFCTLKVWWIYLVKRLEFLKKEKIGCEGGNETTEKDLQINLIMLTQNRESLFLQVQISQHIGTTSYGYAILKHSTVYWGYPFLDRCKLLTHQASS